LFAELETSMVSNPRLCFVSFASIGVFGLAEPAFAQSQNGGPLPCEALANAVTATAGNVSLNANSLVDSYQSILGAYGGANTGSGARVQAAGAVANNGGLVDGTEIYDATSTLAVVPVPAGAINLPLGSTVPGNVNVNGASTSITLAPGNYVASSVNVNFPGSITISPQGPVAIWVTGALNLGGDENLNGTPANLMFLVTSAGWDNVNSSGELFGSIYAPNSGVNLDSAVFGSVVGSSVALNSGAAVHYDLSGACPSQPVVAGRPRQLPPPPNVQGCYAGTWDGGWAPIPCMQLDQLPAAAQRIPYVAGGQVTIANYLDGGLNDYGPAPGIQATGSNSLRFAQVDTTIVNITPSTPNNPAEVDDCFDSDPAFCGPNVPPTPNTFSVQLNTNPFFAPQGPSPFSKTATTGFVAGDRAWAQFVLASRGDPQTTDLSIPPTYFFACIWQNDFDQGKADAVIGLQAYVPFCVGPNGTQEDFQTFPRDLQPLDYASVAGYAFTDADGMTADLGMVVQLSWWDASKAPADYRGIFAAVTKDSYLLGQSNNWQTVSGTLLGAGGGSMAAFTNASLMTRLVAGNCAESNGGTGANQNPVSCASTLSSSGVQPATQQFTDESNNLTVVSSSLTPIALTADGEQNVETQFLSATGGTTPQCNATPHVFVRDYDLDDGATPSNTNGQAFWESPDIIIVASGGHPTDPQVQTIIAGQTYSVYVAVHNDFGCAEVDNVSAQVRFGDASLGTPIWTEVIPGGNPYSTPIPMIPPYSSALIGPITWPVPSQVTDPHQCLLADIQAEEEPPASNTLDTPGSNQVAQRNIEIGNDCAWTLTNGMGANGLASITIKTLTGTSTGQPYAPTANDTVQVMFQDPTGAFAAAWKPGPNAGYTVSNVGGVTKVQLVSIGFVVLPTIPLAPGTTVSVTSNVVPAPFTGTVIDLQIGVVLSNGGTTTNTNGASCQATAQQGNPPPR
jgi:hypothetical protein